jgi:hypothetical protein
VVLDTATHDGMQVVGVQLVFQYSHHREILKLFGKIFESAVAFSVYLRRDLLACVHGKDPSFNIVNLSRWLGEPIVRLGLAPASLRLVQGVDVYDMQGDYR